MLFHGDDSKTLPAGKSQGSRMVVVDRENATQADENGQATKVNILSEMGFYWVFNPKIKAFLCVNVSNMPSIKM
jgi:hypothetical protein